MVPGMVPARPVPPPDLRLPEPPLPVAPGVPAADGTIPVVPAAVPDGNGTQTGTRTGTKTGRPAGPSARSAVQREEVRWNDAAASRRSRLMNQPGERRPT